MASMTTVASDSCVLVGLIGFIPRDERFTVATLSIPEPQLQAALKRCHTALRRIATYVLDPALDQRMLELGENKELLNPSEYKELMALVAFTQKRSLDKHESELALRQLEAVDPELASNS
jgi:hypothetical protein